jgi:hypothetical protein
LLSFVREQAEGGHRTKVGSLQGSLQKLARHDASPE